MYWDRPDVTVMVDWESKKKINYLCVYWDVRLRVIQFKAKIKKC